MQTTVEKNVIIKLKLTQEEAEWLKDFVQNYTVAPPTEESEKNIRMRLLFWSQLNKVI